MGLQINMVLFYGTTSLKCWVTLDWHWTPGEPETQAGFYCNVQRPQIWHIRIKMHVNQCVHTCKQKLFKRASNKIQPESMQRKKGQGSEHITPALKIWGYCFNTVATTDFRGLSTHHSVCWKKKEDGSRHLAADIASGSSFWFDPIKINQMLEKKCRINEDTML